MKKRLQTARLIVTDFLAAVIAWICFHTLRKQILGEDLGYLDFTLLGNAFLIGVFWIVIYLVSGSYTSVFSKSRIKEFFRLIPVTFLGTVVIFFALLLDDEGVHDYTSYYKTFSAYFLLQFSFTAFIKIIVITYVKSLIRDKKLRFNSLLVGSDKNAREIFQEIEKSHELLGLRFVAYVHVHEENNLLKGELRHLGSYQQIKKIIRRCHVEHVIIAIEPSEHEKITEILGMLEGYDVKISIIPDIYQLLLGAVKVQHVFGVPLLEINQDLIPVWQKAIKRGLDIVVSLSVLIFGSPFLLSVALITKLTSKGPIFYSQERIGRDGKPFRIYKFRSMYVGAEAGGPALASDNDSRITPWGKFMRKTRIDEFPQFYNVLIGDMSLVGPRPERAFFIEQIVKVAPHYRHLHRVRPGITSLGQVKFGYAENVDEMVKRLKYDILYIENMSLALDFRIILYTILIMIQGRGK